MLRVDPQTAAEIHLILDRCRTRGTDPVAALDAAGHLNYAARRRADRRWLLDQLADAIETMSPTALGTTPVTAADMRRQIVEFIRNLEGQ